MTMLDPSPVDESPPMPPMAPPHTPPPVPPPPVPGGAVPPARRRRPGGRFVLGLVVGALATAGGGAGALLLTRDTDTAGEVTTSEATSPAAVSPAPAGELRSVHDLVVDARPSIAAIHTTVTQDDIFGRTLQGEAAGTGFVLSSDGYVVTNDHVVDGATSIAVTFDDGDTQEAELVAADPRSDLAVLHVDRTDLTPLPMGDSDAIDVGDPVIAIGNALDLGAEPTVTGGMVSAKDRSITEPSGQVLVDLIQTDAAISPGNSGGPLLDGRGRVVGINTAIAGQGQNIGFAIAINPARVLIDQLSNGEVPRHALLGVSTRPDPDGGAQVVDVASGSAAADAGLRPGDVIVAMDDDTIADPSDLVAAIAGRAPGDEVTLTIRRDGDEQQVTAVLGAHDETSS